MHFFCRWRRLLDATYMYEASPAANMTTSGNVEVLIGASRTTTALIEQMQIHADQTLGDLTRHVLRWVGKPETILCTL
jgi:hypothetical protein